MQPGSTLVSQFIDSFVVLFVAFYIGADWDLVRVLGHRSCELRIYKFTLAIALTPAIYLAHYLIDRLPGSMNWPRNSNLKAAT